MCGVAGIVALSGSATAPQRAELMRMATALQHRGPDQLGIYARGPAGLAHARLSIIDLAGGKQPMAAARERALIAYNGEVFNYVELREELRAKGRTFTTESDTEVVLQAWLEWGEEALSRFDGQFAFALWDERAERLVIARDRLGVRPLYTCLHAGRLYVASEVKGIFAADPTIPRGLDPRGIDETFTFWTVLAPRSVFAGVDELPPGHVRTYDRRAGFVRERAYAGPTFPRAGDHASCSIGEATERVRAALERAVRLRMSRADVPVGAYLSGGLDSSLVAALAAPSTARLSTFSLRFTDAEYDETDYQRLVARALSTDHHEIEVSRDDIARVFPEVVESAERPLLRTAPAPLFLLSRLVRDNGIKVVLTGEGADEVFAGYDLFREGKVRRFWARHPGSALRPLLLDRLYPYLARSPVAQRAMARKFFGHDLERAREIGFAHQPRWRSAAAVKRLFSPAMRDAISGFDAARDLLARAPRELSSWSPLAQDQWLEMTTLLSGYLLSSQGDRMLMAHSVEGRFPFLDTEVVDLASALPDAHKLRVLDEKHVLKRVARDLVPSEITARKKQPYRAPDALALTSRAAEAWASEVASPAAVARAGVFAPEAVARLWEKCRTSATGGPLSNADNMALVGVLSTQLLYEKLVRPAKAARGDAELASAPSASPIELYEVRA